MPDDLDVTKSTDVAEFTRKTTRYDFLDWAGEVANRAEVKFNINGFFARQSDGGGVRCEIHNPRGMVARQSGSGNSDFQGHFKDKTRIILNAINGDETSQIVRFHFADEVRGFGTTVEPDLDDANIKRFRVKLSLRDQIEEHWKDYNVTSARDKAIFIGALSPGPDRIAWANLTVVGVDDDGEEIPTNFVFGRLDLLTG